MEILRIPEAQMKIRILIKKNGVVVFGSRVIIWSKTPVYGLGEFVILENRKEIHLQTKKLKT